MCAEHIRSFCLLAIASLFIDGCSTLDPKVRQRMEQTRAIVEGSDERFAPTVYRLLERGIDSAFLWKAFHHPATAFLEPMLRINVTGFLRRVDYSHNWSDASIRACHHVWSVFASLAAADQPENIRANQMSYRDTIADPARRAMLDSLVEVRSSRKAVWALSELEELWRIAQDSVLDVLELRGSWAGAFGIPQFIPSSYRRWARDGDGDGTVDLFNVNDAIVSVANYLKTNGWGPQRAQQEAALFHYNNSNDYVQCILTVAERLRSSQAR